MAAEEDDFERPLRESVAVREERARKLLELDEAVSGAVEKLTLPAVDRFFTLEEGKGIVVDK